MEKQDWQVKKEQENQVKLAKDLDRDLLEHKQKIQRFAPAKHSPASDSINLLFSCRKRKVEEVMEPKTPNVVMVGGVSWSGPKSRLPKKSRISGPGTSTPVHGPQNSKSDAEAKLPSPVKFPDLRLENQPKSDQNLAENLVLGRSSEEI